MCKGFAWQQELHWKEIRDTRTDGVTNLVGNYFQLGYFFHNILDWFPRDVELVFRHSYYIPNRDRDKNSQQEFSFNCNWFVNGHSNKLTAELSFFEFQENVNFEQDGFRFRAQWDISI